MPRKLNMLILLLAFLMVAPVSSHAAEDLLVFQKAITDMNRLKPLQNKRYKRADEILDRRVLDSANKVVGMVQDIIINEQDGTVSNIKVEFDRLHLGDAVFLDYKTLEIAAVSQGYRLDFTRDQVSDLYPSMLSNIETAAGNDTGALSLRGILGLPLITTQGVKIGEIDDVLFDRDGSYVRGIHVLVNYKTTRDAGVAVPLNVLHQVYNHAQSYMEIDQDYADLILKYAKDS